MWTCPSPPPCAERLPRAQCEQNANENLPHPMRLHPFCQHSSQNASQEDAGDQQESSSPGNKALPRVSQQRQLPCGRNQRHQTCALGTVLGKREQQTKQRHEQNSAAYPEHSGSNSAYARHQKNSCVPLYPLSHGQAHRLQPAAGFRAVPFSIAELQKPSENTRTILAACGKGGAAPQGSLQAPQKGSPARTESLLSNQPGPASNTPVEHPNQSALLR